MNRFKKGDRVVIVDNTFASGLEYNITKLGWTGVITSLDRFDKTYYVRFDEHKSESLDVLEKSIELETIVNTELYAALS